MPDVPWSQQGMIYGEKPNLLSESLAMLNMSVINGSTSLASSSVWDGDGDDMSMDLLTDIDEGSTDEEASSYHHSKGLSSI